MPYSSITRKVDTGVLCNPGVDVRLQRESHKSPRVRKVDIAFYVVLPGDLYACWCDRVEVAVGVLRNPWSEIELLRAKKSQDHVKEKGGSAEPMVKDEAP